MPVAFTNTVGRLISSLKFATNGRLIGVPFIPNFNQYQHPIVHAFACYPDFRFGSDSGETVLSVLTKSEAQHGALSRLPRVYQKPSPETLSKTWTDAFFNHRLTGALPGVGVLKHARTTKNTHGKKSAR